MYLLYVVNRTIGAAAALNVIYFTSSMLIIKLYINTFLKTRMVTFEPRHEKTNVLHMRKQRRRSASRQPRS